jgi:pilus assembly protein CpaD
MSSNRRTRAIRALLIMATAACAAACASTLAPVAPPRAGLTPTQQYAVQVSAHPDEILLAPHADGLSSAQLAALSALVDRWRAAGGGPIVVQAPSHGGGQAYAAANSIQAQLVFLGVKDNSIRVMGYQSDEQHSASMPAPIIVGFNRFEAQGPVCGRDWDNFTSTMGNAVESNFGCAVTANVAAMVANPADLVQARAMDASDATRRETVIGKYRSGAVMSSPKDDQADTQISDAVH